MGLEGMHKFDPFPPRYEPDHLWPTSPRKYRESYQHVSFRIADFADLIRFLIWPRFGLSKIQISKVMEFV